MGRVGEELGGVDREEVKGIEMRVKDFFVGFLMVEMFIIDVVEGD